MSTEESNVNGLFWRIGWSPWLTIIGVLILFVIIGTLIDAIGSLAAVGLLAGIAVWFYGTREINDNYQPLLEGFVSEAQRSAARGIDTTDATNYSLTYGNGDSPPFVEPSNTYYTTAMTITPKSVNINKGAEYDMVGREGAGGGSNRELYYDQISAVESHQDGNRTTLEIRTSGGDAIEISSTDTDTVDSALSDIRQKVRQAK